VVAPLPDGIDVMSDGHFGPHLRRFGLAQFLPSSCPVLARFLPGSCPVLARYHQGQVTVARRVTLPDATGIAISRRQVVRLLIDGKDSFMEEARDVLRAGLETAARATLDDTGARHKARNGVCTRIGNDRFAWFGTTGSKSRVSLLELLRASHGDYVINAEALACMRRRSPGNPAIRLPAEADDKQFADLAAWQAAWQAHLDRLGIGALKVAPDPAQPDPAQPDPTQPDPTQPDPAQPDPAQIATEGALWGSVKAHGLPGCSVIVSDDAGQFNAGQFSVGRHASCWVHAERLVHKLKHPRRAAPPRPAATTQADLALP